MALQAPDAQLPVRTWPNPQRLRDIRPRGVHPLNNHRPRPAEVDYESLRPRQPNACDYRPARVRGAHRYRAARWRRAPPRSDHHLLITWNPDDIMAMVDLDNGVEHEYLDANFLTRDPEVYNHMLYCSVSSPDNVFWCHTMDDLFFFLLNLGPMGRSELRNLVLADIKASTCDTYLYGALDLLKQCVNLRHMDIFWCRECRECRLAGTRLWNAWLQVRLLQGGRRAGAGFLDIQEILSVEPCGQCSKSRQATHPVTSRQLAWAAAGTYGTMGFETLRESLLIP